MSIARIILATIAGVFVGGLFIYAFQALGNIILPPPDTFDPASPTAFQGMNFQVNFMILLPVLLSYIAGAIAGGFFTGVLSPKTNRFPSLITGTVLLIFGLVNLISVEHPVWFGIASSTLYLPAAWLGGILAVRAKKM